VCAAPVTGGSAVEHAADDLVTPASVMKIQIALATLESIATGREDGTRRVLLAGNRRTPGPVGVSLMADDVEISVRDLVPLMMTISDNVATDALIDQIGLSTINDLTSALGLERTRIASDLMTMLDDMAREVGFADYPALTAFTPDESGEMSSDVIRERLSATSALDPSRGSRTTARETVRLLQLIWTDQAVAPQACGQLRRTMSQQLTKHRIAAGFGPDVTVAAKSGGLMGVVRNEAGVVRYPDGQEYAVAVFTRSDPRAKADERAVNAAIGEIARQALTLLRPRADPL
jgi:beta-lactamase class A